jgi:hypothetical protein
MVMPLFAYTQKRFEARYHVQVKHDRDVIHETTGIVPVRGRVVTVFRGDNKLRVGDEVRFSAAIYHDPDEVPPGGWSWTHIASFNNAEYFELFLNGKPPLCEVADYTILIIGAPSKTPQAHVPTKQELSRQVAEWESHGKPPKKELSVQGAERESHHKPRTLLERTWYWFFGHWARRDV